jgi:drug/metabolite transporter (DMT)-like permease
LNKRLSASLAVCLAFILWGVTSIFVRFIDAGPYTFVLANALCGWVMLLPLFIAKKGYREIASPKKLAITIGVGFLQTIMGVLYIQSLQLTTITNGLLAYYTMPMFVILLSPLLLGEKRRLTTMLAIPPRSLV